MSDGGWGGSCGGSGSGNRIGWGGWGNNFSGCGDGNGNGGCVTPGFVQQADRAGRLGRLRTIGSGVADGCWGSPGHAGANLSKVGSGVNWSTRGASNGTTWHHVRRPTTKRPSSCGSGVGDYDQRHQRQLRHFRRRQWRRRQSDRHRHRQQQHVLRRRRQRRQTGRRFRHEQQAAGRQRRRRRVDDRLHHLRRPRRPERAGERNCDQ